ncbi:MAG: MarR family EPS-associated transcriptional regulator [Steroidobacter sp.]
MSTLVVAKSREVGTDVHYKLMRLLDANPGMSQRDVARALGMSLGKVNYCLHALVERGWVKASRFRNSRNKAGYMYLLTPRGIEQKAQLAVDFLRMKMREYETLRAEIEQIRSEASVAGHLEDDASDREQ